MPKLTCTVDTCIYNQDKYCIRNRIHIQGKLAKTDMETQCGSFKLKQDENKNIYMTEFARFGAVNEHLSIDCDSVNCAYNSNLLCSKNNVKIEGCEAVQRYDTLCKSFCLEDKLQSKQKRDSE